MKTLLLTLFKYFMRGSNREYKRAVLLASIYSRFTGCTDKDRDSIKSFAERMGIKVPLGALFLPILMASLILPGVCKDIPLSSSEIINRVPEWLIYSDNETVKDDLDRIYVILNKTSQLPLFEI